MDTQQRKELRAQAQGLSPITSVGKNGISENTIELIAKNLKANKLCKVKLLRTYLDESGADKKDVAQELADRLSAELVQLIGLTVILYKK